MRALLDVNVLIALFDADHSLHGPALKWFDEHGKGGWASCPLTQNGCIRVMSQPGYANPIPVHVVAGRLREAVADHHHEFWPDELSLLDERAVDTTRVHGPKQLTDVYLLALAVARGGRLVTFDRSLPVDAVLNAQKRHLVVI
jgi:toxin-antitoxin system PIN domain toxin